jgi:hypothetical protein
MLDRWNAAAWPEGGLAPLPELYWVRPGRLLAGPYAGAQSPEQARARLGRLLDAGITSFVDLTEAGEAPLPPYEPLLAAEAAERGLRATYLRAPIPDFGLPTLEALRTTLEHIDAELLAGRGLYLHCRGGIGRTGTVVGCHLVRHGLAGADALAVLARLRRRLPSAAWQSPETDAQRALVLAWAGQA